MPPKYDSSLDYYAILGVRPDATPEQIRSAYREQTKRVHPDRGGSHHQMVELIAAYEVLSDPATRAEYDALRSRPHDQVATQHWEPFVRQKYEKAEKAVRDHGATAESFERWVQTVTGDFTKATYGEVQATHWFTFPTVSKSISGQIFLWLGVVLTFLLVCLIHETYRTAVYQLVTLDWDKPLFPKVRGIFNLLLLALPMVAGAWLGVWTHKLVGRIFSDAHRARTPSASSRVVICQNCGQKMRLPALEAALVVTCPRCHTRQDLPPQAGNSPNASVSSSPGDPTGHLHGATRLIVAYAIGVQPLLWLVENALCMALYLTSEFYGENFLWDCAGTLLHTAVSVTLFIGGIFLSQRKTSGITLLKLATSLNLLLSAIWFASLLIVALSASGAEALRDLAVPLAVNMACHAIQAMACLLAFVWLITDAQRLHTSVR